MFQTVWYTKIQNFWTLVTVMAVIADVAVTCMPCQVCAHQSSCKGEPSTVTVALVKEESISDGLLSWPKYLD